MTGLAFNYAYRYLHPSQLESPAAQTAKALCAIEARNGTQLAGLLRQQVLIQRLTAARERQRMAQMVEQYSPSATLC